MKPFNRREMCAGLTVLMMGGLAGVKMSEAQTASMGEGALAHARVLRFSDLPVGLLPNGTDRRVLAQGALATGEAVRVHESIAPPAAAAPDMHAIQHSELIVVVQGTVGMEHDGKVETGGPGDVLYVAFGTNHRIRNMGDGPARYVVISIGGDVKT
ncbi:MAG: cupin domain-containing protein [Acidobacteriaceae bacterium]|nr:cupin domain-containing protein [Acidobacteriaceae bacterium]